MHIYFPLRCVKIKWLTTQWPQSYLFDPCMPSLLPQALVHASGCELRLLTIHIGATHGPGQGASPKIPGEDAPLLPPVHVKGSPLEIQNCYGIVFPCTVLLHHDIFQ